MVAVPKPSFMEERALLSRGITVVAGVDEAGSGSWAGPVYAAAVILPFDSRIGLIRDSKTLSYEQRTRVAARIKEAAAAWAVGTASVEEICTLNIRGAGALAMRRAVESLAMRPEFVLVDAFTIPGLGIPAKGIIKGDLKVKSIAAASVLAKVERDSHMEEIDRLHPGYGFAEHRGYGTKAHQAALSALGPCAAHRRTYEPIRKFLAATAER